MRVGGGMRGWVESVVGSFPFALSIATDLITSMLPCSICTCRIGRARFRPIALSASRASFNNINLVRVPSNHVTPRKRFGVKTDCGGRCRFCGISLRLVP